MRRLLAPSPTRAALVPLLSLCLISAACGDDLEPIDETDDGDGDGDDGGGTTPADTISIEGLDGPVDVYFDDVGILHARCQTDADCLAVEGYFHAAHRFGQMDIRRRVGRGKLSALAGAVALEASDKLQRRMMTTREGTPLEDKLLEEADAQTLAGLEAYSRGVNAWMQDALDGVNGAVLPDEYSFFDVTQEQILSTPWEPVDSVACILPLLDQLTNHADIDIAMGNIFGTLEPALANDLFGLRTPSDSVILPPPPPELAQPGATAGATGRRVHERMAAARPLLEKALEQYPDVKIDRASTTGSNNWIVGPSQTSGGVALLANDPHLTLAHPSIWYIVHLDAKTAGEGDIHVAGASFPGLPGILLGQTEDIAWGVTTTYYDSTDVYLETLNAAGDAVIFNDAEVPIQRVDYTFEVASGDPVTETFEFVPHHGPIIEKDVAAGTAVSVRWAGHDADTDLNFLIGMAKATSIEQARTALESITTAGQNFVIIDRAGSIGWFPYARVPTRPWLSEPDAPPPFLPLPGDGSAEWGDFIPYAELPQAVDPAAGFLATANNDMTGALRDGDGTNDGQEYLQGVVDEGYRHQRIVERLEERSDHDLASMQSIQADVRSLLGQLLVPEILAGVNPDDLEADGQAVYAALEAWAAGDYECTSGIDGTDPAGPADAATAESARACLAFHATWGKLRLLAFGDELADAPNVNQAALPSALIFLMTEDTFNQAYWDDIATAGVVETPADIIGAALNQAGTSLRENEQLGAPENWLWGRVHTVTLAADLLSLITDDFNSGTYANDGGLFTVDVASPRDEVDDRYEQTHGPSTRLSCLADEERVSCTVELPGGQRHLRDSPFYTSGDNSLLDEWLTNRPLPLIFSIDEVANGAAETVTVEAR